MILAATSSATVVCSLAGAIDGAEGDENAPPIFKWRRFHLSVVNDDAHSTASL